MISLNSLQETTSVINSRASKKKPVVWRRRKGMNSGITFTTYERASLAENKPIHLSDTKTDIFNLGKLILSIADCFQHDRHAAQYDSLWLAQTVEEKLLLDNNPLTRETICSTTHAILKRFDALAAFHYATKHHLISNVRKRGRPSLSGL